MTVGSRYQPRLHQPGFRDRAAERVTLELGPRSEQEIRICAGEGGRGRTLDQSRPGFARHRRRMRRVADLRPAPMPKVIPSCDGYAWPRRQARTAGPGGASRARVLDAETRSGPHAARARSAATSSRRCIRRCSVGGRESDVRGSLFTARNPRSGARPAGHSVASRRAERHRLCDRRGSTADASPVSFPTSK